jgi:alanine racemase
MNTHPTHAVIDMQAFRHNCACVRSSCGAGVKIMAVVKANAYGHGVVACASAAASAGVEALAVARVEEALALRRAGIALPLLVFELPARGQIEAALAEDVALTVGTGSGGAMIGSIAQRTGKRARIHVKVDTGMGRLGFRREQAEEEIALVARHPGVVLEGIYSHFATAGEPDETFARLQLERFLEVLEKLSRQRVDIPLRHMANSGAIVSMPDSHLDMVRPGIMLYGYMPVQRLPERFPVRPVMSLLSTISLLKQVEARVPISYGRTYTTTRKTTIATVPIGYADGFSRRLTGRISVLVNGKAHPVVGTICMDHCMLDLGLDSACKEGDEVVIIGKSGPETRTAWDLAEPLETIPYEITCQISERVSRVVRNA